jgi:hypothetical protein
LLPAADFPQSSTKLTLELYRIHKVRKFNLENFMHQSQLSINNLITTVGSNARLGGHPPSKSLTPSSYLRPGSRPVFLAISRLAGNLGLLCRSSTAVVGTFEGLGLKTGLAF